MTLGLFRELTSALYQILVMGSILNPLLLLFPIDLDAWTSWTLSIILQQDSVSRISHGLGQVTSSEPAPDP